MFIAHPSVPIQRLRRFSSTVFDLSAAPFTTTPFDEQGHSPAIALTLSAATVGTGRTAAATGAFLASDVGRQLSSGAGLAVVTGYTSADQVTVDVQIAFAGTALASGAWTLDASPQANLTPSAKDPIGATITLTGDADVWRAEDAGKFVRINGGLCKVLSITSATIADAKILVALTGIVAAPALAWSIESDVWTAANGYPRTLTLHEQRLVAAGSTRYPQTIWGSRTGEYLDFMKGTADDDSYSFTIAADEVNPISYVASLRNLVVHTYGGEFSLQGGVEKPITPTNVRIRSESAHGSKGVRPVTVGKESAFVQRAGRKLRAMGYRYDFDGYASPDLTVLAEHITEGGGITFLAYQQEPDQVVFAGRGDGALLTCTLDRDQSVTGWAAHFTDGAFESGATIPNGDREETWVLVRRRVSGATVRYLELFDDTFEPALPAAVDPNAFPPIERPVVYGCTVDCGVSFDNVAGQTSFSVPHLIGKTVDIVADGAVQPRQVVPVSGIVTTRTSYRTLIGLPFRSEIGMLTPEVGTGSGTAQGNSMRTAEVTLRFLATIGASVYDGEGNEQQVPFRRFGLDVLDAAVQPFTGNVRIETLGWDRGRSELTIVQDQPLPMHLLAVVRKFTVND
jgi:hypothetical protein